MHRAYRPAKAAAKSSSGVWKTILIGLVLTGAAGTAGAWLLGYFSEDPALAEVRQIQQQLDDPNLSDDARRELFTSMRTKMEALPEETRRLVWQAGRERFEQRFDERMRRILAMAPADRTKALDEEIDREEERRKRRLERQAAGGGPPGGGLGANAGGNRPRGNLSDQDRINRMRSRLDRSTAEQRSMRNQMRRLVEQRRRERGLPPGGGGPGRGRG